MRGHSSAASLLVKALVRLTNRPGADFWRWREAGTSRNGVFDEARLLLSFTSPVLGRFVAGHVHARLHPLGSGAAFAARHLARDGPVIRKQAGTMALLSFTGFSVCNRLAYWGLEYTTAIDGPLLQSVAPLFVALWTLALFGERLTLRQACGIGVSLAGVPVSSPAVLLGIQFNRGDAGFVARSWSTVSPPHICASGRR